MGPGESEYAPKKSEWGLVGLSGNLRGKMGLENQNRAPKDLVGSQGVD